MPCFTNALRTRIGSAVDPISRPATLTATGTSKSGFTMRQRLIWLQTSFSTQRVMRSDRPLTSATPMKRSGGTMPRPVVLSELEKGLALLPDSVPVEAQRTELKALGLAELLGERALPVLAVLTKADKLASRAQDGLAAALARALDLFLARPEIGFVWLAYEDGKPVDSSKWYFKWNPAGAKTDELVFVNQR